MTIAQTSTQAPTQTSTTPIEPSRARRLREATHDAHVALDQALMDRDSFRSREGYEPFLAMQFAFHRDIDALYTDPALQALLPGLAERRRLPLLALDVADLDLVADTLRKPLFAPGEAVDPATALGWLYVAEGSNLGAAVLRKLVSAIGLSDEFGARHLAPADDGPAAHWRRFVAALDAAPLDAAGEDRAIAGARAAFAHVAGLADAPLA